MEQVSMARRSHKCWAQGRGVKSSSNFAFCSLAVFIGEMAAISQCCPEILVLRGSRRSSTAQYCYCGAAGRHLSWCQLPGTGVLSDSKAWRKRRELKSRKMKQYMEHSASLLLSPERRLQKRFRKTRAADGEGRIKPALNAKTFQRKWKLL